MENYTFRGKRQDNYEWVYGFLANVETINDKRTIDLSPIKVIASTVSQQVGLTDMSGRDVYFGDIVKFTPKVLDEFGVKYIDAPFAVLAVVSQDEYGHSSLTPIKSNGEINDNTTYHVENLIKSYVVGNIHDDKDYKLLANYQ